MALFQPETIETLKIPIIGKSVGQFDKHIQFKSCIWVNYAQTTTMECIRNESMANIRSIECFSKRSYKIVSVTFANRDMNNVDYSQSITDYPRCDILRYGLEFNVAICKVEHKIQKKFTKELSITCPNMKKKNFCPIYDNVKNKYDCTMQNLMHIQQFTHYKNENMTKPQCRYGLQCKTFIKFQCNEQVTIFDQCHKHLYRHPPVDSVHHSISTFSDALVRLLLIPDYDIKMWNEFNYFKYEDETPTNTTLLLPSVYTAAQFHDVKERLINEVIKNGFARDLCLKQSDYDAEPRKFSLVTNTLQRKMKLKRHKEMGEPLQQCEMLALLLYTGGRCTYDLTRSQNDGDYSKWYYLDLCLYNAIIKLNTKETGTFPCYSGLRNVKLISDSIEGYFPTYVSTSYDTQTAMKFAGRKNTNSIVSASAASDTSTSNCDPGIILCFDENIRSKFYCCDVSWISKHKKECELLISRSIRAKSNGTDIVTNGFKMNIIDIKDELQFVRVENWNSQ